MDYRKYKNLPVINLEGGDPHPHNLFYFLGDNKEKGIDRCYCNATPEQILAKQDWPLTKQEFLERFSGWKHDYLANHPITDMPNVKFGMFRRDIIWVYGPDTDYLLVFTNYTDPT